MTTATLTPTTTSPITSQPLSNTEADTLLISAAGLEKPTKVRSGLSSRPDGDVSPRAWSRGGNVD